MPRWLWFAPLVGLTAVLAVGAYKAGVWVMGVSETDAILMAAEQYTQDASENGVAVNQATDCVARPGQGAVWITVTCGRDAHRYVYQMDRLGRFITRDVHGPNT